MNLASLLGLARGVEHVGDALDENVEVVLEQKQHTTISYDKISTVVATGLPAPALLRKSSVQAATPTPPKKHYSRLFSRGRPRERPVYKEKRIENE